MIWRLPHDSGGLQGGSSVCPSVRLSACPPVRLSACPPVRLSVCPSVRLSVCPSGCKSKRRGAVEQASRPTYLSPCRSAKERYAWPMNSFTALACTQFRNPIRKAEIPDRLGENPWGVVLLVIFLCRDRGLVCHYSNLVIGWEAAGPAVRSNPFEQGGSLLPNLH